MRRHSAFACFFALIIFAFAATPAWPQSSHHDSDNDSGNHSGKMSHKPHDIVFIILDDVGIDQLPVYDPTKPLPLANINAIGLSGVKFGNTWVMPECSPSRAVFFTGRYPMRTGVTSALIDNMLPVSQVSPYETTIPRVLAQAGYSSALVGKFHLGEANPSGNCSPATLGWDYFNGNLGASPGAIDISAGDKNTPPGLGTFGCGFNQANQSGSCYQSNGSCQIANDGKACLDSGGLFLANQSCTSPVPSQLDFTKTNAYYVWQDTINQGALPQNTGPNQCHVEPEISREYMTTAQTNIAVNWWQEQKGPRMVTVAYNTVHTPFQQPPASLVPNDSTIPPLSTLQCQGATPPSIIQQRLIAAAMLQAMDLEIGRLLQGMGLAKLDSNGTIITATDSSGNRHIPELEHSGTQLVVVGDNGTYAFLVKPPFAPDQVAQSKGSVYQTGVWVPLIVAGNLVQGATGRIDNHMINGADLFQLFGEMAGVNVDEAVPPAHVLDGKPMLSHLSDPDPGETRTTNFTQLGPGVFETPTNNQTRSWPCVVGGSLVGSGSTQSLSGGQCSEVLFSTRAFCEQENNGIWFGPPDSTDQNPLQFPNPDPNSYNGAWNSCCDVQALNTGQGDPPSPTSILPINQYAERDTDNKFVERQFADCTKPLCPGPQCTTVFPPFERKTINEFYSLKPTVVPLNPVGLDINNLACDPSTGQDPIDCVPAILKPEYKKLQAALNAQLNSEVACLGDGNLDKRVNLFDLAGTIKFLGAGPSIWDFNDSGQTDFADVVTVAGQLGKDCIGLCARADLNRDGQVNDDDLSVLKSHFGPCKLCGSDLNGDGVVNELDVLLMKRAIRSCPRPKEKADSH